MPEFWRVENSERHGPYRTGADGVSAADRYYDAAGVWQGDLITAGLHPLPSDDGGELGDTWWNISSPEYRFGFNSKEQALEWWESPEGRAKLHDLGYSLVMYNAKERVDGNMQSVALVHDLEFIASYNLAEL